MYEELQLLAGERSSEKRVELLRRITALFLQGAGAHSRAEEYLFADIMDKILESVTKEQKIGFSRQFAVSEHAPHGLVCKLAGDEDIDVARPVILRSPVLTDEDLVGLARSAPQSHLNVIARRPTLSTVVTDVLIGRGDRDVVQSVSANASAQLSTDGVAQLLEKARTDIDLGAALVDRPDLSQGAVDKLLPLVSASLAVKLAERGFDVGDAVPPEVLQAARQRLNEALRDRESNINNTNTLISKVEAGELPLDAAAAALTKANRMLDLATLLAPFIKLDRNFIFNLIATGQIPTILMAFRAVNLSWPTVADVLTMRAKKRRETLRPLSSLQQEYQAIDPDAAVRAMRFIKVRLAAGAA